MKLDLSSKITIVSGLIPAIIILFTFLFDWMNDTILLIGMISFIIFIHSVDSMISEARLNTKFQEENRRQANYAKILSARPPVLSKILAIDNSESRANAPKELSFKLGIGKTLSFDRSGITLSTLLTTKNCLWSEVGDLRFSHLVRTQMVNGSTYKQDLVVSLNIKPKTGKGTSFSCDLDTTKAQTLLYELRWVGQTLNIPVSSF